MTCAANRTRPLVEPLLRISSASSQFTEERANHSSLRPTTSVRKAGSRPSFRAGGLVAATSGKWRVY
jgi:hypothetical protein